MVAEEVGDDSFGEGGGILAVDLRVADVGDHDGVEFLVERGVGDEVGGEEFVEGGVDDGEVVMGIDAGAASGGEVFAAREDSVFAEPAIEVAGVVDDVLGVAAPAASAQGVGFFGFVIDVEVGGEVEVDPEHLEVTSGEGSEPGALLKVALGAEGAGVGRSGAESGGAPDAAAFVVDADEGGVVGEFAEFVGEGAGLLGVDDVSGEEDVAGGLVEGDAFAVGVGEGGAVEAEDEWEHGVSCDWLFVICYWGFGKGVVCQRLGEVFEAWGGI